MAENSRTQDARDNDDKDLIEGMIPAGDAEPSSGGGGALGQDIGKQADLKQIDDPDGRTRATKSDDMAAGQSYDSDRRGSNG